MLIGLAEFVIRFRWWVIAFWTVVLLASVPFAPLAISELKQGYGEVDTESSAALRLLVDELGVSESSVVLVFSSDELEVSDPAYLSEVQKAVAPLAQIPEVARVVTFYTVPGDALIAADRRTTYAFVDLDTKIDAAIDVVEPIRNLLGATQLDVWVTGGVALFADISTHSEADLRRSEIITVPLLALALLIVFGGVVAAGLPVTMGLISVITTLALVFAMAQVTDMSVFVLNIASFLGLGMAVDYSLLMVSRFREELDRTGSVNAAVAVTLQTSGKAIVFSAGTSVVALSGLLYFEIMMLRSLGIGGITVILSSMLIALTLLPALFAVLGSRIDALSLWRVRSGRGNFWRSLSGWVMRHPLIVIVPVIGFLVLLGLPFLNVNLGSQWESILPEEAESRRGSDLVADRFGPGELSQIILVETSPTSTVSPQNIVANLDFIERMEADPRVVRVESLFGSGPRLTAQQYRSVLEMNIPAALGGDRLRAAAEEFVSDDRRTQMIRVVPRSGPTSQETRTLVDDTRASPPVGDMVVRVTGTTAYLKDTVDSMYTDFPKVVVYVVIVTYLALLLLFRSVLLPLKAVALNALSILASFGALVFVFQYGNFQDLLGFTTDGFTESTVPILVFSVVFGLSMDYEVFLLSRVKEEYEASGDNTQAVAVGMERSGRVITSAAAILILVSAGFATGDILIVKALGLGTAIAVLIDSTIVRALLVPALMRVLSGLNWWAPGWLGGPPPPDRTAKPL